MNINSNELLLLNKKIKFAGEAGKPAADVTVPAPETNTPQTGLNALMFQGLNNVVSDPQLAGELKIMSEANTEKTEDKAANEYIAPYKSNLAFQGKASKFKSIALAALMGLATLGATSTLTSCDDKEYIGIPGSNTNNVTINIDFDKITAMFQQMQEMWQQMLEQQQITNEQLQQNNEFMKQLLQMYQEGMADANEFYEQMYNFIMSSTANQEIIIGLLEQNGMSQEEANNLLRELIAEVQAGNLSAAEAMDKIMDLLGDIKGLLSQAISDFNKFYEEMLAKQDELIETNKQGFEELINQGNITNATLEEMKAQNDSLMVLSNKQIEAQNEIKEAIEKANLDSNANFDKVVETLNVNKNELIEALKKLGYSQEEIIKMTASQIIDAIDNNTATVVKSNELLYKITEYVSILPEIKENGDITNTQLKDLYDLYMEIVNSDDKYSQDIIDKMEELVGKLESIEGILNEINKQLAALNEKYQKMLDKQDELVETNQKGFEELINQGNITNATLNNLQEQSDSLIILSNMQIEAQNNISKAIEQANLDSNANFDKVISTLNINQEELINVLIKMGYKRDEIIRMTASQITNAINKNTYATERGNALLANITRQLMILPELYKQGKITNAQLQKFYELYQEAVDNDGELSKEVLTKLEQLLNELENIEGVLNEILETLTTLSDDFNEFKTNYENDKKTEFAMLGELVVNNKFQSHVIANMSKTQKQMLENIKGMNVNIKTLLEIAQDDSKHQELIDAIKDIQAGGSTDIDYQKLEDMFKMMGLTISDAINMSSSQLENAIKNFQNTYLTTEQEQTEQLVTINEKLDDLKIFDGTDKTEIIEAINDITTAINNGSTDITNELKNLSNKLDKMQASIDAIYKAIGNQAAITNTYFAKWDGKFDSMLGSLVNLEGAANDIKSQLSTIIANQKTTQVYLDNLLNAIAELKEEIKKLQDAAGGSGSSITIEQLEELWKQHDEANYNKYKELIENLDINVDIDTSTIEDLLTSIDNKMEYINDNSEILTQILNKLNSIDWSNPDYTDKLDKIIEILENFKCNCDCGGNNEGILGDLDDVLG